MSASPKRRNLNPTVEEVIDDSSDEKKNGYAKSNCNVAVKRSTDLGKHKQPDHTSDSGYSSRTATSKRSADSAKSSKDKTQDPAARPETPPPAERPIAEPQEKKRTSRDTKKPTKPVIKQGSKREERTTRVESKSRKSRRDNLPAAAAETDQDKRRRHRLSVDTKVERASGHVSQYHPSFSRGRTPVDHVTESGVSRPRLHPAGGRPVSYHAGSSSTDYMNANQGYFGHAPPPAMLNPHCWMGSPVGTQFSPYTRAMGLPSPLTPHMDPRFGATILHQGGQPAARTQPRYNPRYGQPRSDIMSPRQDEFDEEEAYDPLDQYDQYDQDRQDMPPPSLPPQRRPSVPRQGWTTPNIMPSMYHRVGWEDGGHDDTDEYGDDDPRLARQLEALSIGNTGRGRSATSPESRNSRGRAQAVVEPAQSKRRDHLTRRNTVYNTTVPSQAQPNNARRDRADERRKSQIDDKQRRVEEYVRGVDGMSLENPIDRLRTGSGRRAQSTASPRTRTNISSRHGHDDGKSRVSDSGTALSRKTNNLIIKVHDDNDIVEIQGDVSGKAIRFGNGEDGGKQIIIADARDKEKYYIKDSSHTTEDTSSSRSRGESDRRTKFSNRTECDRRPKLAEQQWVQQDQRRQQDQWRGW